jgi:outer membrane receptor protein involved in Fe transport
VIADIPNTRFCKITPPVSAGTQVKFHGAYTLPWDFQVSGILQNTPGPEIQAIYQVTNAIALPSLGRNLSSGRATVPLIEPGTRYEGRATQLDLRFAKNFRIQGARVTGMVDVYNSLNANPILGVNNAVGPSFQNVTAVMAGRLFKFGAQVEF